jgi:hypothetical protein
MRVFVLTITLAVLATSLTACRGGRTSPAEITLQTERMVNIFGGRARVAIRERDIEQIEALLHIECEGTDTTILLKAPDTSEEVCGMQFRLKTFNMDGPDVRSANLTVTWDDE